MSKYYYLVAGLPELTLEDSKLSYTVADFKTEIYPGLSSSDQKLIDLFYLKFDNANVLKLLKDKDAVIDLRGNFSAAELNEYIATIKEGGEVSAKEFPSYLSVFISDYFNTPAESEVDCLEQLMKISEITELVEREKKLDSLRWNWMEEATFFDYFTVERIFAFLLQLEMIERWIALDKEKGNQLFRSIIDALKDEVQIPAEFR